MKWQVDRANLLLGLVAWCGIAQFAICVYLAIEAYPGGYALDSNFLSDLGCSRTSLGDANTVSATLFNYSIIVLGCAMLPFLVVMPSTLVQAQGVMRFCGVMSSLGLIGIGMTPYDQYWVEHHLALLLWLGPLVTTVIVYFVAARDNGTDSWVLGAGTGLFAAAVCGYTFVGSHDGHVVFQKLVAVVGICWFCVVFVSVSLAVVQPVIRRRVVAERQAEEYLTTLARNRSRLKLRKQPPGFRYEKH
jgi:hypothetical membrane protein